MQTWKTVDEITETGTYLQCLISTSRNVFDRTMLVVFVNGEPLTPGNAENGVRLVPLDGDLQDGEKLYHYGPLPPIPDHPMPVESYLADHFGGKLDVSAEEPASI